MTKVDNPELFRENIAKKLETILEDNKLSINALLSNVSSSSLNKYSKYKSTIL